MLSTAHTFSAEHPKQLFLLRKIEMHEFIREKQNF